MSHHLSKKKISTIQTTVLDWYKTNKRNLPWRSTRDPYHILVSEIMLQQTQVSRVIPKYEEFLKRFPTVGKLASVSSAEVIRAWKGLGYNRRALNLQRAARVIVGEHNGKVPSDLEALRELPGIGRYTAGAIRNFASGIDTPAVDTNVKQFLDHFVPASAARTENDYYDLAEQLMPEGKAREWLHAVMDYSALVLKSNKVTGSTLRVEPRKSEPFVGSNRYLRGRIIDRLRDQAQTASALFAAIAKPIDVEQGRFQALVTALQSEGFLTRKGRTLRLV